MQQKTTRRGNTQETLYAKRNTLFTSPLEGEGLSPRVSIGDVRRIDEGGYKKENFICSPSPRALRAPLPQGARGTTHGFTLIELLVVVLIIGILAAVALPQYNKSVMKAQGAEVLDAVNALDKGVAAYYLEHGTYEGISNDTLAVQLPELKYFSYANDFVSSAHKTQTFIGGRVTGIAGRNGIEDFGSIFELYLKSPDDTCVLRSSWNKGIANKTIVYYNPNECKKYFNLNCNKYSYEVFPGGPMGIKEDCYLD